MNLPWHVGEGVFFLLLALKKIFGRLNVCPVL